MSTDAKISARSAAIPHRGVRHAGRKGPMRSQPVILLSARHFDDDRTPGRIVVSEPRDIANSLLRRAKIFRSQILSGRTAGQRFKRG